MFLLINNWTTGSGSWNARQDGDTQLTLGQTKSRNTWSSHRESLVKSGTRGGQIHVQCILSYYMNSMNLLAIHIIYIFWDTTLKITVRHSGIRHFGQNFCCDIDLDAKIHRDHLHHSVCKVGDLQPGSVGSNLVVKVTRLLVLLCCLSLLDMFNNPTPGWAGEHGTWEITRKCQIAGLNSHYI